LLIGLAAAFLADRQTPVRAAVDWPQPALVRAFAGVSQPTTVTHAGDGSGRIFVTERTGKIRIVRNGVVATTPFLDLTSKITSGGQEQGLLGLAFPPGYASKRHFYVYYTRSSDGAIVIARYRLTSTDLADAASEQVVITIPHPAFQNHNGGQIAFGPGDGYLYAGPGDGGSGGDPNDNAQNTTRLLGKLLRLDVEAGSATYVVPPTNPTLGGQRSEIWAYGLRNPWRFSFDRQTHDLYIADVGQGSWEEIDFQSASSGGGENYGWRLLEGAHCFNPSTNCPTAGLTMPVAEYSHASGCSVSGGYVYRGPLYPRMRGVYFYGDYCSGQLWGLSRDGAAWQSQQLLGTAKNISTFGEDEAGNLYLADFGSGTVYQLTDSVTASRVFMPLVPQRHRGV
ncbi:MAG TPA: PQQ-dependent sugar dehydrogenase, partial [Chloroflexota bacterium]